MAELSFDAAFSLSALLAAAGRAARGKRMTPAVARFRLDQERHLVALRAELLDDRWHPAPARLLRIHDPKPRLIAVPSFRDRVVHQALAAVLGPRVERRLITGSMACREGAGSHAAARRAITWARTWHWWVRLDVVRFFPTVDHAIVRAQLREDVPDARVRALCERILDAAGTTGGPHFPGDDLFDAGARRVGLPLGSLTSQLWANRFLDPVDHMVKDRLRLRGYLRYMDDMLLFHDDREALVEVARRVEDGCHALRLRLHPWCVQPTRGGVGFVGYRVTPDQVRVRGSSWRRARGRLQAMRDAGADFADRALRESLRASFAHWAHADSWRLRERVLRDLGLLYEPPAPE